jgi:hypothetical protein
MYIPSKKMIHHRLFLFFLPLSALSACPNGCSKNGVCTRNSTCVCEHAFTGADCSLRLCPNGTAWADYPTAVDEAHAMAECSNMGICNRASGVCKCRTGFMGSACQFTRCPGGLESGKDCNGHGRCMPIREAAEFENGYNLVTTTTYNLWDANKIMGCVCDEGWTHYDCSERSCPYGDDPLETASGTADEVQAIDCLCSSGCAGTFRISFRNELTESIAFGASAATIESALESLRSVVSVVVTLDGGSAVCDTDGASTRITFTHQPGNLPLIKLYSSLTQTTGTPVLTAIGDGASSSYGSSLTSVMGNRQWIECSNRGICNRATGICACSSYDASTANLWSSSNGAGGSVTKAAGDRFDCGFAAGTPSACPSNDVALVCSGHGTCSGSSTFVCTCDSGFTGADCSLYSCPTSTSWFDEATSSNTAHASNSECSNRGICDVTTGKCTCDTFLTGTACGEFSCPSAAGGSSCNGAGSCQAMSYIAQQTYKNGVLQSFTYGSNSLAKTWDYNKIYSCLCDRTTYHGPLVGAIGTSEGYDCSVRRCPTGDDPYTVGQLHEVQDIKCTGTGGTISLTFRSQTTDPIAFNAANTVVETALEALSLVKSLYDAGVTVR